MNSMLAAPGAMLLQFKPIFQGLLVFVRLIVGVFADRAFEFDEIVLGHKDGLLE